MSKTVTIPLTKRPNLMSTQRLYKKSSITIGDYTIIAGCNGAGKTTLCRQIVNYCKQNDIPFKYCNGSYDFKQTDEKYLTADYKPRSIFLAGLQSEHEHIEQMFGDFIGNVRPPDEFKGKDFFVIIDGLDSGGRCVLL